jgi:hypothetical protein
MVGTVAIGIFFAPKKNFSYGISVIEIIIVGLNITYAQNLLFSGVVGVDPWFHQMFTNTIIESGRLPIGTGYSKLPLFHLEITSVALINDLNYKFATLFSSNFLLITLNSLMVFLLGRFLFSEKIGLFGSLFLITANYTLSMAFVTVPNSMAAIFILPILFLMFNFKKNIFIYLIILLFMISIILTHTISAMAMAIILIVGCLTFGFYKKVYKIAFKKSVGLTITLLFIIIMLVWWIYASGHINLLLSFIQKGFREDIFLSAPETAYQYGETIPIIERFFNQIGIFLFFSISFIGIFYMVSKKYGDAQKFTFANMGLIILSLAFFPMMTGTSIIQERWLYFSQIMLALPLALSIIIIINLIKNNKMKVIILSAVCIGLSFLMITSSVANIDNLTFSPNSNIRYALSDSEVQALKTIENYSNNIIYTDEFYGSRASFIIDCNISFISDNLLSKNFSEINGKVILIRREINRNPFWLHGALYKLNYNLFELFGRHYSHIYSSNEVESYI